MVKQFSASTDRSGLASIHAAYKDAVTIRRLATKYFDGKLRPETAGSPTDSLRDGRD